MTKARAPSGSLSAYVAIGPELINFAVDIPTGTLDRRGTVTLPSRVQCAWPHPTLPVLYAACADRGGDGGEQPFYLCALARDARGDLHMVGTPASLPARPIHLTADMAGRRLLTAYSQPARLTVHALDVDGHIGAELPLPDALDVGSAPHQVRVTRDNRLAIIVARGKKGFGKSSYIEGALKVLRIDGDTVANCATIQPERAYMPAGFNPRSIDFHPTRPLLFASLEEQNQLAVFGFDGSTVDPVPLFVHDTLAYPDNRRPRQDGGSVHVHPNGRTVYVGNRNDGYVGGTSVASWLTPNPVPVFPGGENMIAVFAIDQASGEPTLLQYADTQGLHPREFALDPAGRILIVGNSAPTVVRDGDTLVDVPAGLVLFRVCEDGTLDFERRYDVDLGGEMLWWTGLVG